MAAISHHLFYASLANKEAKDQLLYFRYGAAISYLTKAALASSVVVAYKQQIWETLQRKALSVAAIDSLFSAAEDVTALTTFELYKKAKLATALIVFVW